MNGRRNQILFWAACRAFEMGGDPELVSRIEVAAITNGLDEHEVRATIQSAANTVGGAQ